MNSSSVVGSRPAPNSVASRLWRTAPLLSRIAAALLGGYGLAALTSVAALALPMDRAQAVLIGMLTSFIVYAAAVIWVFAVRSATRAWVGLVIVAVPLALAAWAASRAVGAP